MNMDEDTIMVEKRRVINGMAKFGGDFIKALCIALGHADMNNTIKIKKAWHEEWYKYLNMNIQDERRSEVCPNCGGRIRFTYDLFEGFKTGEYCENWPENCEYANGEI